MSLLRRDVHNIWFVPEYASEKPEIKLEWKKHVAEAFPGKLIDGFMVRGIKVDE
jgi:hypothetical protein